MSVVTFIDQHGTGTIINYIPLILPPMYQSRPNNKTITSVDVVGGYTSGLLMREVVVHKWDCSGSRAAAH
jgi:hypothetical protein